jgi:hypothetical protein
MQHVVPSLSMSGRDGRLVHSLSENGQSVLTQSVYQLATMTAHGEMVPHAACIQCDLLKTSIYGLKHVEEYNVI